MCQEANDEVMRAASYIGLTDDEIQCLTAQYETYYESISSLLKLIVKYEKLVGDRNKLETRIASLNYDAYDLYMQVHTTAIAISGLLSETRMMGYRLTYEELESAESILREYLIINRDY